MPKVVDAARVTTRDNTVWRTCTECGQLRPIPDGVERCDACLQQREREALQQHALNGWEYAHRYTGVIGRIEAWALLIPNVSDAERLDHIRQALSTLDQAKAVS
ncbi:hypothetical protein FB565_005071 [Actinoplanes lutulentus]|uniref:Uncharacterized protein n=1 Tax=Actinoplanes lutulentus TaxID=1287878 RepID=A0A327ZM79_9ACTN|nr:hypothetical protein [Actinoplanes lutulentus]MBB2945338.1 hypothetical protein [Actinoplanes lutulentus]RAK40527.1 hypothetical protein B0I29_103565 [Actinoplanes lutulentus]